MRGCFENILAAKRLLQNIHELPTKLIEELRSALKTEEEIVPQKTVHPVARWRVTDEARSHKYWP